MLNILEMLMTVLPDAQGQDLKPRSISIPLGQIQEVRRQSRQILLPKRLILLLLQHMVFKSHSLGGFGSKFRRKRLNGVRGYKLNYQFYCQ